MCDCLICGDEVPEGRAAAGILICLECGEHQAQVAKKAKARATAPLHKGNYVYLGSGEQAKANVLAISQMRRTG
jgi:ribosomal protein L37AE/L43A